jgi:hypothetical protein
MKSRDLKGMAKIHAEIQAQREWSESSAAARAEIMRLVGARRAPEPVTIRACPRYGALGPLLDHSFCGRTSDGVFIIGETWCIGWGAGGSYFAIARQAVKLGFKISPLPTAFSTRWVGERRPVVIVPPGSDVEPQVIYAALVEGNFKGVHTYEPP